MHVLVLGAGITGVTTAWYLRQAGFDVSVADRQPEPGLETSFANGGQISISHPEPWASPAAPWLALRWLGRDDAPLKFRPAADTAQWRWAVSFLRECLPWRARRNTEAIAKLAVWSGTCLRALRAETALEYDHLERGILHLFYSEHEFSHARARASALAEFGIEARVCNTPECIEIEPALHHQHLNLAGGLYAPHDESGDAMRFCQALTQRLIQTGVRFHWRTEASNLAHERGRISGVDVRDADGRRDRLSADAIVVCLGSYSPSLTANVGERLPIYPVKGYSITAKVLDPERTPEVSLTDESRRIVCSRLGQRLRVAGTAELNGFDTRIRAERIAPIVDWVQRRFPGAIDLENITPWAGLRPATPSNVPMIGRSSCENLWFNTGHGTLGWTLSCGSASALASLMKGERPAIDFPFLGLPAR